MLASTIIKRTKEDVHMEYQAELNRWMERAGEDPDLIAELLEIREDEKAVSDRFYRHLAFGTGDRKSVV